MREPHWLSEELILAMHDAQIAEYGGSGCVRDFNLLKSAMDRPVNRYRYHESLPSLFELAAAYVFGIAKNHAFNDGNKRTALAAMGVFLGLNRYEVQAPQEELFYVIELLATSDVTEQEFANWLKLNTVYLKK